MSRGYNKHRRGNCHNTSFQFDNLYKENSNKPSASRSTGTVGKWGITSFTSIRANGSGDSEKTVVEPAPVALVPRPKKFFKSRNSDSTESTPAIFNESIEPNCENVSKRARSSYSHSEKNTKTPTKRFFSSKNKSPKAVLSSNTNNSKVNVTKPPIVLRICRGKSQLVSDSEDSESTQTPTTTIPSPSTSAVFPFSTSPESHRSVDNNPPPARIAVLGNSNISDATPNTTINENTRITRSSRRSMQQDQLTTTSSSTTDGLQKLSGDAVEQSLHALFSSPRNDDLEPQYIPAEKYELERKAMYDNLLGTSTVKAEEPVTTIDEVDDKIKTENQTDQSMEEGEANEESCKMVISTEDESKITPTNDKLPPDPYTCDPPEDNIDDNYPTEPKEESEVNEMEENCDDDDDDEQPNEQPCSSSSGTTVTEKSAVVVVVEESVAMEEEKKTNKEDLADDWSTDGDSDSNSTLAEIAQDPVTTSTSIEEENRSNYTCSTIETHKDEILDKILEKPSDAPSPVKLVISKKKGSIFKSRALVADGGTKKRRALYRHKWCDEDKNTKKDIKQNENTSTVSPDEFGFQDESLTKVVTETDSENQDEAITSVKCSRTNKGFYTVVRNVKKAHQIQEIGEFQEFNDDVDYILDTLQDNNPISTRCLSAITLASKCMAPAFRMHVRAHGTVAKFFKALHDSTKDQSLGLCTATVMFVLSQDRLNMDLDRDCLELMLNLLESDVSYQQALDVCGLSTAQLEKNKQKVRELCAEIQSHGHAMHLNLDNITVGQLAMETLLSLTSKRAGEWFKEELRELGGLEHIMKTICECCRQVSDYVVSWTDSLLDKLRKVDRCLRVLENVTHNNEENQTYLLKYNNGILLDTLVKLYRLCDSEIPLYPVADIGDKESAGSVIREALLVTLKVLINLTHHFNKRSTGSSLVGQRPGIMDASLHLLLQIPHYIPDQKKFELGVLVLMLLINLIQENEDNKKLLINAKAPAELESVFQCDKSAVEALVGQFHQWEDSARLAERRTDAILDGEKDGEVASQPKSNEEFIEETVANLLQKAGTHMEYTFLASYLVLLLGYLIMENEEYQGIVRQFLKNNKFDCMVGLLNKFFNFMNLTSSTEASSVCAIKATEKVIHFLERCDKPAEQIDSGPTNYNTDGLDLSFSITH